jgi:hypothetical protein
MPPKSSSSKSLPSGGSGGGRGGGVALGQVEQILTKLAPNDASHDFGNDKPNNPQQMGAYNKGLYGGSGNKIDYGTEAESLSMVVSDPPNYVPITSANEERDYCRMSRHQITVLGDAKKTYTVNYADVKYTIETKNSYKKMLDAKEADKAKVTGEFDAKVKTLNDDKNRKMAAAAEPEPVATPPENFIEKFKTKISTTLAELTAGKSGGSSKSQPKDLREEIDAPMFYHMMGLDPNQNIALVIDAASIGIIEILSNGTFPGKRPIVYYIYGPEVVHDPASKKHPSSPEFKDPTKWSHGVHWIPCVSMNPRDFVYCYDYNPDPTGLYLNKFFTSFEFGLSELQETVNGKTIDYTTDLTIKAFDGPDKTKVKFIDESIDSKSKSDISFLTEMIQMLRTAMASGDEKEFQYAIAFLKKMAGDWLQVLLALAIAMRSRGFTPYRGPTVAAAGGGGAGEIRRNITATIDRVFFLTHDQIALAFALCNGVECIFTHHTVVKGKGNPSLHSAFLYSLMSAEKVNASIIEKAKELAPKNYAAEIANLTDSKREYDERRNTAIRGPVDALKKDISVHLTHTIANPFQVDWFDKYVKTLFTASLKIVAIKKILPDLSTIDLDALTADNAKLKSEFTKFESAGETVKVEDAKKLLELDAHVNSQIKSCEKMIASAKYFFSDDGGGEMKINKEIREFTKELIYVAAANWTWDSPEVSTRKLVNLTSMDDQRVFNADRNIFINHLNSLDDDIKSQITLIFARCYDFIEKNNDHKQFQNTIKKGKDKTETTVILTDSQFQKFKPMATTFCYEVFLNLGGKYNIPRETITKGKIDEYCDRILAVSALTSLLNRDNISEIADKRIEKEELVANHISEGILVRQMTQPDNGGIESFSQERIFSAEEIGASSLPSPPSSSAKTSTSPPSAPTGKPSKNSMRFSSVFSACQLLKERILSNRDYTGARGPLFVDGGAKNRAIKMKGGAAPICNFHHQLPLYILLFQLHKTLSNENFEESLDYELTLQYYGFLLSLQDKFAELKENKDDAVKIGLGIRDFFFINNVVSDDVKVKELPPMPSKMLSFSGLLTTGFCGALNEEYFKNVKDREESINDPVFVEFIKGVQIPERFSGQIDLVSDGVVYKDFVKAVSKSANEVAQQIIADRASEREQMINDSVSNVDDVVVEEGDRNMTGPGLTAEEMQFLNPVSSVFSGLQQPQTSYGGKKTRRRKRTRRPKKQNNKKTRKRRR